MTETEIFESCDNLSKDELNTKTDKNVYVKNDAMSTVIKRCTAEKNRRKKNRCIYKKMMIPRSGIPECPEHKVKPKIGNIFVNENHL